MKESDSQSYRWILQTLASATAPCCTLETVFFKQDAAELWFRPDKDGNLYLEQHNEKLNIQQVLEHLMTVLPPHCFCLCYTGNDVIEKTLADAKTWIERKQSIRRIGMLQVLPCGYQHKRTHCLDLRYINRAYQCKYTIREDSHTFECNNDRWFRKLKDVSTRTIKAIESATAQRLLSASFSFLIHEGEIRILTVSQIFLMSDQCFLAYALETARKETLNLNTRPQSKARTQHIPDLFPAHVDSKLASPLRIRTPAFTTPSSPRKQMKDPVARFPPVSPRPSKFFSYNFKEMVARTIEKEKTQGRLIQREKSIGELIRDDETFFALIGVEDENQAIPNKTLHSSSEQSLSTESCKTGTLLNAFYEQSLSTVSTITPPIHLTKKSSLLRLLKPLKKRSPQGM